MNTKIEQEEVKIDAVRTFHFPDCKSKCHVCKNPLPVENYSILEEIGFDLKDESQYRDIFYFCSAKCKVFWVEYDGF